jgi:hypothetical protein
MPTTKRTGALLAAALAVSPILALPGAHPAWAQDTTPATTSPGTSASGTPAASGSGTPQFVVASVRLDGGWRASKFIGSTVYDDQNQKIGSVDDLVMSGKDKVAIAVVSVGGFLGIGNKLVAVPFDHLSYDPTSKDAKVVMTGASKDTLTSMPSFTYNATSG